MHALLVYPSLIGGCNPPINGWNLKYRLSVVKSSDVDELVFGSFSCRISTGIANSVHVNFPDIQVRSGQWPFRPMTDSSLLSMTIGESWFGAPRWTLPPIIWIIPVSISNWMFCSDVVAYLSSGNKKWILVDCSSPMELCWNKVGHSKWHLKQSSHNRHCSWKHFNLLTKLRRATC